MPGSIPPTSQLDWLISTTAMIVLLWSRATRDLLKSFGWGIAALHRLMQRRSCHVPAARPVASIGPAEKKTAVERGPAADHRRLARRPVLNDPIQLIGPETAARPFTRAGPMVRIRFPPAGSLQTFGS